MKFSSDSMRSEHMQLIEQPEDFKQISYDQCQERLLNLTFLRLNIITSVQK